MDIAVDPSMGGATPIEVDTAKPSQTSATADELLIYSLRDRSVPHLSIIIPVFNTAPYIVETLDSLAASGFDSIEFVIVNDGSTDGSEAKILDWLKSHRACCVLVRIPNRGPSTARNVGLRHARGDYVTFSDSDDLFDAGVHRHMLAAARAHDADQVIVRSVRFDAATLTLERFSDAHVWDSILGTSEVLVTRLAREPRLMRLEPSPVVRLFGRKFLERVKLEFPEGIFFEDLPIHIRAIARSRKVVLLSNTGLYYRVHRTGQTTAARGSMRFQMIESARLALDEALATGIDSKAGANVAGLAIAMLFWCGQYCEAGRRQEYFSAATAVIGKYPALWRRLYIERYAATARERLIIAAFDAADGKFLANLAFGVNSLTSRLALAANPRAKLYRAMQCRGLLKRFLRLAGIPRQSRDKGE